MTTPSRSPRPHFDPGKLIVSRKDRLGALVLALLLLVYAVISMPSGVAETYTARVDSLKVATELRPSPTPRQKPPSKRSYANLYPADQNAKQRYPTDRLSEQWTKKYAYTPQERHRKIYEARSLNKSDSAAFEELPGIGPVLATRIVRYREKLGGFYSKKQLREVYGISDSVYALIEPLISLGADSANVIKLDINNAPVETLQGHPYLRWDKAKAIVNYRKANGPYRSVHDLEKIWTMNKKDVERLLPYLRIDTVAADGAIKKGPP